MPIESLSSDLLERRMLNGSRLFGLLKEMLNGSRLFALLSHDFEQIFGQIVSIRMKTLGNTNMVASRLTKREKGSLPVDVCRSKTSLLKLPNKASFTLFAKTKPQLRVKQICLPSIKCNYKQQK